MSVMLYQICQNQKTPCPVKGLTKIKIFVFFPFSKARCCSVALLYPWLIVSANRGSEVS